MIIHRVFDEVFRSWSHVAVLRTLLDTTSGHTGNEVARISGMHPRSALKALTSLEELGIVRRQRGGRDHLFTLNREHFLVRDAILALYQSEKQFPDTLFVALAATLKKSVVSAIVFGSVAKHEETPQSDLDLCCIVKTELQKNNVRETVNSQAVTLFQKFGVRLAPLLLTVEELRQKSKTPLVEDIVAHGRLIVGKNPKALLNG
jgi:DNA-binding transcriptional ArsR family regulator